MAMNANVGDGVSGRKRGVPRARQINVMRVMSDQELYPVDSGMRKPLDIFAVFHEVVVTKNSGNGRKRAQLDKNAGIANIACMDDVVAIGQSRISLLAEPAMRVRYDSN